MALDVIYKRVVGLDVHQSQITACGLKKAMVQCVPGNGNLARSRKTGVRWYSG